jgi:hypothetical protein
MPTKKVSACDESKRLTLQAALLDNEAVKELVNKVMEATPEAITHIKKNLKSLGYIDENDELPPKVTNSDTAKNLQDWKPNSAQQRKKSVIVEEFFDNEVPKSANEATVDFLSSFLEKLEPGEPFCPWLERQSEKQARKPSKNFLLELLEFASGKARDSDWSGFKSIADSEA